MADSQKSSDPRTTDQKAGVGIDPEVAERLRGLSLMATSTVEGFLAGRHRSPRRGISVEFAERRPYVQGDDLRHLDWKAYARTDRLVVKRYEEETNLECTLVVDASGSMAYGPKGTKSKYDHACQAAAALAHLVLRERDGVATALFDHLLDRMLPASTSSTHLQSILLALVERSPAGETNFEAVLGRLSEAVAHPGLVVLISDCFGDLESLSKGLGALGARGHECLVLHVMHSDELTFPFDRLTRFEDMEGDDRLLVDAPSLQEAYLESMEDWRARLRRACHQQGVDYALLDTSKPLGLSLSAFLGARAARVRRHR
ncbi:MAG: DUF58 domain-containing protein [Planctomycetota bacterium]|nr:DUF58 domain-containing protein [Planctomycetota bacterium]